MKKLLLALLLLLSAPAAAQTLVPVRPSALPSATTLLGSVGMIQQPLSSNKLGFDTGIFSLSAGNLTIAPGTISPTLYLPSVVGLSAASSDNSIAINAALLASGGAANISLPCGTFKVASPIQITQNNTWLYGGSSVGSGGGEGCTIIEQTTATGDVIDVSAGVAAYYVGWLTLDRTTTATGGAGLNVGTGAAGTVDHVESIDQWNGFSLGATNRSFCLFCTAISNYNRGFLLLNTSGLPQMQWELFETLAQFNNGWGYDMFYAANGLGPRFIKASTFANNSGGFVFEGDQASDVTMDTPVGSTDNGPELYFVNPGTNIVINEPFLELAGAAATGRGLATAATHTGEGFLCDTGGLSTGTIQITGGISQNNSYQGFAVASSCGTGRFIINGLRATDNGNSGSHTNGFELASTATVTMTGVSANNEFSTQQVDGLSMANPADVWVSGADFSGNATAGCNTTILGGKAVVNGSGC